MTCAESRSDVKLQIGSRFKVLERKIKNGIFDKRRCGGQRKKVWRTFYIAMHLEKAAGGRFCSQESREKFFPPGNWMTIPSPYDMLEEE